MTPRAVRLASGVCARLLGVAGLVALLSSCATPSRRAADAPSLRALEDRELDLARQSADWSLHGKIAVSDGRDGGSGRIDWQQRGERFVIEIRAPVSRRTWRLTGNPQGAMLEGLDGGPRSGPSAEALLQQEVGWTVPIADMVAWARGTRGVGEAQVEFDPLRRPARILQRGWTIEYRAWADTDPALPSKIFAARGDRRVRLVVERWDAGSALP